MHDNSNAAEDDGRHGADRDDPPDPVREANLRPVSAAATCSTTASAASPMSSNANRCPSRWAVCRVAPAVVSAFEREASATPTRGGASNDTEKDDRTQPALGQGNEHDESGCKRQQRASAIGEVEANAKRNSRHCRDRSPEGVPTNSDSGTITRPDTARSPNAFQYPIGFAS